MACWNAATDLIGHFRAELELFALPQAITPYADGYGGEMWNVRLATATMLVFIVAQKQFVEGLANTGRKGRVRPVSSCVRSRRRPRVGSGRVLTERTEGASDVTKSALPPGAGVSWVQQPDHRAWLRGQLAGQLRFARGFAHPEGGAWYLDDSGSPDRSQPVLTWITARMAHVYSLGHLAGLPGCRSLAAAALEGLTGRLRDDQNGGWFASLGPGEERDETKAAYAHAFVVFASSSATVAGVPGARALLDEALAVLDERFWEQGPGLHRDSAVADWSVFSDYRGVNANMHSVEALLSAADTTGDVLWRDRASRITSTVLAWAAGNDWRIPEHFDPAWVPMLEHHRDQPDHPFEPYGATVGHGLEWARLALHVRAALGQDAPAGLLDGARKLFARAVADGWAADGADGFVYTTDWSGAPVVRQRMHWVLAEAISAAAALSAATGDPVYDQWYRTWWEYAVRYLVTPDGSWRHELDPANRPAGTVWPGRPDLYHSVHAVLLQRLPLAPTAPTAIARGLLR